MPTKQLETLQNNSSEINFYSVLSCGTPSVIPIKCSVKNYAWGTVGSKSLVAKIMKRHDQDFLLNENEHYAELWMGTHPAGPSHVTGVGPTYENAKLSELLAQMPEFLGTISHMNVHGRDLPYLFKVLSIGQPLSIQVHPPKQMAKELHQKDPSNYADANHKPELAIAITDFEALCSFRPHEQIQECIGQLPSLINLIGENAANKYMLASTPDQQKWLLRDVFFKLLSAKQTSVQRELDRAAKQFMAELDHDLLKSSSKISNDLKHLFLRIRKFYPDDVGCFLVFFFNYMKLAPGQSIFIGSGEPHCYLSGDCVECMARGDNTIRAGLTPKFKDIDTLCKALTYETKSVSQVLLVPKQINEITQLYDAGADEFAVEVMSVHASAKSEYTLAAKTSGSIMIVTSGHAIINHIELSPGYICFIPAMVRLKLTSVEHELTIYRAFTPTPS